MNTTSQASEPPNIAYNLTCTKYGIEMNILKETHSYNELRRT